MMFLSMSAFLNTILILTTSKYADSKLIGSRFNPKDVGAIHNDIFSEFGKIHASKKSNDVNTLKSDFIYAMTKTCEDEEDAICIDKVLKARDLVDTYLEKYDLISLKDGTLPVKYPSGMGSKLKSHLDETLAMSSTLDPYNLEAVINNLSRIETEIESYSFYLPSYKNMALSALSVAKESTRLWHAVVFDEENPLSRPTPHDNGRRLDEEGGFLNLCMMGRLPLLINADIIGVLITPVTSFTNSATGSPIAFLPVYLFNWFFEQPTGAAAAFEEMRWFGLFANYAFFPFLAQTTAAALPTSYLSFMAYLLTSECQDTETDPSFSLVPSTLSPTNSTQAP